MKSSIYIIVPHSNRFLTSERVFPAIGALAIKAFLEENGHSCWVEDEFDDTKINFIQEYDYIGFSSTTAQWRANGKEIANKLKKIYPEKKIIVGGAVATYHYKELSQDINVDFIIKEAGEKVIINVMNNTLYNRIVDGGRLSNDEFNKLPLPWRDKTYLNKYQYNIKGRSATSSVIGLGCPMNCYYCEARRTSMALSNESRLYLEMKQIKSLGYNAVMFYDDIALLNKPRTQLMCDVIGPMDMYWRCFGHSSLMYKDDFQPYLKMLYDAQCKEICFGFESGSQKILDAVGKGNKVNWNIKTIENILDAGITCVAFIMLGLPNESYETIEETEKILEQFKDCENLKIDITIFYPFEGTYIRDNVEKFDIKLYLEEEDKFFGAYKGKMGNSECIVSTNSLSREEIMKEHKRLLNKFAKITKAFNDPNTKMESCIVI